MTTIHGVHQLIIFLIKHIIGSVGGVCELGSMDHLLSVVVSSYFIHFAAELFTQLVIVRSHLAHSLY